MTVLSINLIVSDPHIRGGRPCIDGTGIRITDVVNVLLFHESQPEKIADWFGISLAEVYAALSYYYQNKAEIDADLRAQIAEAEQLRAEHIANGGTPLLP